MLLLLCRCFVRFIFLYFFQQKNLFALFVHLLFLLFVVIPICVKYFASVFAVDLTPFHSTSKHELFVVVYSRCNLYLT